ncbi:MAG: hypothetical protein ACYSTO_09385, partial [Planctomycetota bacterium]
SISWIKHLSKKRNLKRKLVNKACPRCGCSFAVAIEPFHPPYDEWIPRKERTDDYWLFYCANCRGDIWVNNAAEIVESNPPEQPKAGDTITD